MNKKLINDIKNNLKSIDKEKIILYLSRLKEKLSDTNLEDIKQFIIDKKNSILTAIFSSVLLILLVLIVSFGIKTYSKYFEINQYTETVSIVRDDNIKKYIQLNKLRNVDSLMYSYAILLNTNINKKNLDKYKLKLSQSILLVAIEGKGNNYISYSLIKDKLLDGLPENAYKTYSSKTTIKSLILLISDTKKLKGKFGSNYNIILNNYYKLIYSNIFNNYISSFPKVSKKQVSSLSGIKKEEFMNVLKNLYVWELVFISNNLKLEAENQKKIYEKYQEPYKKFLSVILLPSVNIWKNPFSGKISVDIFGLNYLNLAKYMDLNLVKYWSDYFTYSYKGLLYQGDRNEIQDISVSEFKDVKSKNIKILPLVVKFGLNSDRSFYGLLSRLTSTSNIKNVMLITEFTNVIWGKVKNNLLSKLNKFKKKNITYKNLPFGETYIAYLLKSCLSSDNGFEKYSCSKLFACKDKKQCVLGDVLSKDYSIINNLLSQKKLNINSIYNIISNNLLNSNKFNFDKSSFKNYFENEFYKINDSGYLVGALMHDCLINKGYCELLFNRKQNYGKNKYSIIRESIEEFSSCNKGALKACELNPSSRDCISCKYKFIDKFDTNYFIAYTMVNKIYQPIAGRKYTFVERLQDVYSNMAGILELGKFSFSKLENDINLYVSDVNLDIYYKYLSNEELSEILSYIGREKCPNITNKKAWNINLALSYINKKISSLYKLDLGADEIYSLNKIKSILENLKKNYKKSDNLIKLLAELQSYRLFLERGYCSN